MFLQSLEVFSSLSCSFIPLTAMSNSAAWLFCLLLQGISHRSEGNPVFTRSFPKALIVTRWCESWLFFPLGLCGGERRIVILATLTGREKGPWGWGVPSLGVPPSRWPSPKMAGAPLVSSSQFIQENCNSVSDIVPQRRTPLHSL